MKTTRRRWTRWAPLLTLLAILAACSSGVAPAPAASAPDPAPAPAPEPAARVSCDDSAIRLLDLDAGVHGAIVADTLHLGGATAPATCTDPTNESRQAGGSMPDDRTAQVQQSEYYLIVIRYTSGNRLYVVSRRGDGTSCVVDTNDECVAHVTDLPDDFDLDALPEDVARTIPAGRPAPPTVSSPAGGDDTPPAPNPPAGGDDASPGASPPPAATGGPPRAVGSPQPRDGATGVSVDAPLLSWAAVPGALSYDVHWDRQITEHAGVNTTSTFLRMSARRSLDVGRREGRLEAETTYYWRVDSLGAARTPGCPSSSTCTQGTYWSFTTGPATAAAAAPDPRYEPPGTPGNPQPRDGATGVRIDAPLLGWSASPGATSYDVHWAATESAITSGQTTPVNTSTTSVTMTGDLEAETTYYWRVDAKNRNGATAGNVWSFTTRQSGPGDPDPLYEPPGVPDNPRPTGPQAPAWPAAATNFKIEGVVDGHLVGYKRISWTVPAPTGNPKPTISTTNELWPRALGYHILADLTFYSNGRIGAKGTITLVASNSEGRAELNVPYNLTCRDTLAERLDQLRGSWVPCRDDCTGTYTALTIGDTITTVPASTGSLDRDLASEVARGGRSLPSHYHANGHTVCHRIYHPEWTLSPREAYFWNYGKHFMLQVGCERMIALTPRQSDVIDASDSTIFVPAGCDNPPYGDPPEDD